MNQTKIYGSYEHNKLKESDKLIKKAFHELWTESVGKEGYEKKKWVYLRDLLNKRGLDV